MNNLGQREYTKLIKAAGVRRIKFHGLRHTCATLLLPAGEPVRRRQRTARARKVSMTMEVYAHVCPTCRRTPRPCSADCSTAGEFVSKR